jgi:hypothetical protein
MDNDATEFLEGIEKVISSNEKQITNVFIDTFFLTQLSLERCMEIFAERNDLERFKCAEALLARAKAALPKP